MKNNKSKIFIFLFIFVGLILGITIGLVLANKKDRVSLSLEENEWIDTNKHDVIDIAVINDIPLLNYEGEGLIYDYLDFVKSKTSLEFNIISYKVNDTVDYNYKFDITSNLKKDEILLYKDNLTYYSIDNKEYKNISELSNLKIGVIKAEKEELTKYFEGKNIELVEYEDYDKLKSAMKEATENLKSGTPTDINGIIIIKSLYTKEMIENNSKVSYQFNDLNRYYVLNINDNQILKSIMFKEYKVWKEKNYEKTYNDMLLSNYYKFKKISDVEEKKLKSKNYIYGYINYGIINNLNKKQTKGFNSILLKKFNEFSGITIKSLKYNSLNKLISDFNSGKVDFVLDLVDNEKYTKDIFRTSNIYNKKMVVVSGINNKISIDNILSLKDIEVLTIKDTDLESNLKLQGINVKSYNNLESLVSDFSATDVAILDIENFNYYKTSNLKDCRISYIFPENDNYKFVINNKDENKNFEDLFDFYITYSSVDDIISSNYADVAYVNKNRVFVLICIIIALLVYIAFDFMYHIKNIFKAIKIRRKVKMTKEDKMKYIDQLTSLKNRNYLNSRIEEWDNSEVYPQSVIIVDLNNVSYINDNYGREEGDKVIKEAANILIQNQLENSEIIRTDGNEFLIFLVGYTEKQIISYLRKLSREFKNLSHGFGAASGYSIITDAIKTFDDAVNEAVLDMKNNKEDIDY